MTKNERALARQHEWLMKAFYGSIILILAASVLGPNDLLWALGVFFTVAILAHLTKPNRETKWMLEKWKEVLGRTIEMIPVTEAERAKQHDWALEQLYRLAECWAEAVNLHATLASEYKNGPLDLARFQTTPKYRAYREELAGRLAQAKNAAAHAEMNFVAAWHILVESKKSACIHLLPEVAARFATYKEFLAHASGQAQEKLDPQPA